MDWWKIMSTWRYHCSCNLVALKLYNNCSYIVVIVLHELHMYMVSHMVSFIHCNSCSKKYVELQWVANGQCNSKTQLQIAKFLIMKIKAKVQLICLGWRSLRNDLFKVHNKFQNVTFVKIAFTLLSNFLFAMQRYTFRL
jgi:hypothetical protein